VDSKEIIHIPKGDINLIADFFSITRDILKINSSKDKSIGKLNDNSLVTSNLIVPYRNKNKWGYSKYDGSIVIDCIFDYAEPFLDDVARVKIDDHDALINKLGIIIFEEKNRIYYSGIPGFVISYKNEGVFVHNYVNQKSFYVYKRIHIYTQDGIIWFANKGHEWFDPYVYGFLDLKTDKISECKYAYLHDYNEGFFIIGTENISENTFYFGFMDLEENIIIPTIYEKVQDFSEGLAGVKKNKKWGFVDKNGDLVIHPIYRNVRKFKNGISQVYEGNKWGIIDKKGKKIVPSIYERMNNFSEGLAPVRLSNKWGFINEEGNMVIPCIYEDTLLFKNKYAAVRLNKKWGFINIKGEIIIDFKFEEVGNFNEFGFAYILEKRNNNRGNIIDEKGISKIPKDYFCSFQENTMWENRFIISYNGKYGCINDAGKVIIPFKWDSLEIKNPYLVIAEIDGQISGYINKEGKTYWTD
jgi:hypothetical protein